MADPATPRRSLGAFLLGCLGAVLLIGLMLTCLAVASAVLYLHSAEEKRIDDVALLRGGSISFQHFDLTAWSDYPTVRLSVDSLRLSASPHAPAPNQFLRVGHGDVVVRFNPFGDTLFIIDSLLLRGGAVSMVSPELAPEDVLLDKELDDTTADSIWQQRIVLSEALRPVVEDFAFRYRKPSLGQEVAVHLHRLQVDSLQTATGFAARLIFDAQLGRLQFSPDEGAYGKDASMQGMLEVSLADGKLLARGTALAIGGNDIDFDATIFTDKRDTSVLTFRMDSTQLVHARPLLAPRIQAEIADYDVAGVFQSTTTLKLPPAPKSRAWVCVDLHLPGNRAQVPGLVFNDTYLEGRFINRPYASLDQDSVRGSRFEIDSTRTMVWGLATTTRNALVQAPMNRAPILRAPEVYARGSAAAIAALAGAQSFSFPRGQTRVHANVRGPLNDINSLLAQSNGSIALEKVLVGFAGASAQLPLQRLVAVKTGANAEVEVHGLTPTQQHPFAVSGTVEGVRALLRSSTGDSVRTSVTLAANHLTWEDALALFELPLDEHNQQHPHRDSLAKKALLVEDLKTALRQLQASFDPNIDVRLDTLSYYGFAMNAFETGVHFRDSSALVLERSRFLVDTGTIEFDGTLDLYDRDRTAFEFKMEARHLNLARLLPEAEYFGQDYLRDLGRLPDNVNLDIVQGGTLDHVRGLLPNQSIGRFSLVSNGVRPFKARAEFEPDRLDQPDYHSARVWVSGSPELFNGFFQTERFTFSGGQFGFWMGYNGMVPNLQSLIDHEEMTLDVQDTQVRVEDLETALPIERLALDVHRDTAQLDFFLRSKPLQQELRVTGVARNVSEVAFGSTGKTFSTDVQISSPRLVWNDLNTLLGTLSEGANADQAPVSFRQNLRSLMRTFRPRVRLDIGEIELDRRFSIEHVVGGFHMTADDHLFLDTTAFDYRAGSMQMHGDIELANLAYAPFHVAAETQDLNLASLLANVDYLDVSSLEAAEQLAGSLSLDADLSSAIAGVGSARLDPTATQGHVDVNLEGLVIDGLAEVDTLAQQFKIAKRTDPLLFAPLRARLNFDGPRLRVPLTEVSTNAFTVFVAGELGIGDSTNLWVSVPFANLTAPQAGAPLQLQGFDAFPLKIHVELDAPPGQALDTKLRWGRKQFWRKHGEQEE